MASTVKLLRSAVPGKVPTALQLEHGYLAINYADRIAYFKDANNIIRSFDLDSSGTKILSKLLSVDGHGSQLDADKLDGKEATEFASSAHTHDAYLPKAGGTVSGTLAISSSSNDPVVKITQTGNGPAILVEDQAGDSTPFEVDAAGNMAVGGSAEVAGNLTINGGKQVYHSEGIAVPVPDGGTGVTAAVPNAVLVGGVDGDDPLTFSAPGAAGTVLMSNGETEKPTFQSASALSAFPPGTIMLFGNSTAPSGWTKLTDHDDAALRVVSGAISNGGTTGFSSIFNASRTPAGSISGTVGATALTIAQIPAHTHTAYGATQTTTAIGGSNARVTGLRSSDQGTTGETSSVGSGQSHTHSFSGSFTGAAMNFAVKYVDVIRAQKD